MSTFGLFKRNTNIIKKIDKSNSYSFDYQKNSYIFIWLFATEGGLVPQRADKRADALWGTSPPSSPIYKKKRKEVT